MLLIIKISFTVDETEIFRFVVYSIHIFLLLIVSFIVRLLESRNKLNSLYSIIELTAYDVFVIEIGYLHWTYKVTIDVSYQDPAIQENKPDIDIDKVSDNLKRAQGMCGASSGNIPTDVGQPAIRVSSITVGGTVNA